MRRSTNKILTTHVGALPGPLETWEGVAGESALRAAVHDVVAAQLDAGTDVVNEGELTKGGNWVTFINSRLSGFEGVPAEGTIALLRSSEDWKEFDDFYAKAMAGGTLFEQTASAPVQTSRIRDWMCREPITYTGQAALEREIGLLKVVARVAFRRRCVPDVDGARERRGRPQERVLQERRGIPLCARGCAEGRVRDDRESRPARADRRRLAAGALGSHRHQDGSRGVPTLLHGACRGAEPRARERAGGASALSPLLG